LANQQFYQRLAAHLRAEQDRLYRLAFSYAGNEQDAMDILQTALVKALTAAPLREPQYLGTWVYRIVVNTALDWLRLRKRFVPVDDGYFDAVPATSERAPGEDVLPREDLKQALDSLPTEYKTIVVLRYFEELKLQEVADVLELNVNTVKTRLYAALRMLRLEMEV